MGDLRVAQKGLLLQKITYGKGEGYNHNEQLGKDTSELYVIHHCFRLFFFFLRAIAGKYRASPPPLLQIL